MLELLPKDMFLHISNNEIEELIHLLPEKIEAIKDMNYMLDDKALRIEITLDLLDALKEGNRLKAQAIFEVAVETFKDSPLTTVH